MPFITLNNIEIILFPVSRIHFGYSFSEAKVLSPILADETHSSFLHIILHVRLAEFHLQH